jgi:hypothetical protein
MLDPLSNDLRECNEIDDGLLSKERVLFTWLSLDLWYEQDDLQLIQQQPAILIMHVHKHLLNQQQLQQIPSCWD